MSQMNTKKPNSIARLLPVVMVALGMLLAATAHATTPGITGTSFSFSAEANYNNQPDGAMVYSWGYGCSTTSTPSFLPTPLSPTVAGAACPTMQIPGPTLIVREGTTVSVTLTNNLPTAAGNTSILFPGFNVTATNGVPGLLTREAIHGPASMSIARQSKRPSAVSAVEYADDVVSQRLPELWVIEDERRDAPDSTGP